MRFLFDLVLAIASGMILLLSSNYTLLCLAVFYIAIFDIGYTWPRKPETLKGNRP